MHATTAWYLGYRTKTAFDLDVSGKDYGTPGVTGGIFGGALGRSLGAGSNPDLTAAQSSPVHRAGHTRFGASAGRKRLGILARRKGLGTLVGALLGAGLGAGYEAYRDPTVLERGKSLLGFSPYDGYGQSAEQKVINAMTLGMM